MVLYDMPLWRPPSEGPNLIIQATLGCSFNACTFCSMYKTKDYQARPLDAVFADIDDAARDWPEAHRVFLADGDALGLDSAHLEAILQRLAEVFPDLQRVSAYATPINLNRKSAAELARLRDGKLTLVYLGVESGADEVLKRVHKGSASAMASAIDKAAAAGIKVSATVILGLGGTGLSDAHIDATVDLINSHPPKFLSTLQLGLEEDQEAVFRQAFGKGGKAQCGPFSWLDDAAVLGELERLIEGLSPSRAVIFRSNHASNCLPLAGTLPKDKARLLSEIRAARNDSAVLRPAMRRGL